MKLKKKYLVFTLFLIPILFFSSLYLPISKKRLREAPVISLRLVDRNNILLREVLSDEGGRCHWIKLKEVSPYLLKATVVAEDKHFYNHPGINPLAIARAFFQNMKYRRIVSGASTITQQLVRNIYHFRRTIFAKILESWLALRLEHTLSKDEILVQYLNRIPYGNQAIGAEAASHLYFNKTSSDLSLAEAAFLAALPRSPSKLNPYRYYQKAKKRQREILLKMNECGLIGKDELGRALEEMLNICSEREKFRAPHFCDYILRKIPFKRRREISLIQTSIDYSLQEKVEVIIKSHLNSLEKKGVSNGAAIILDNITGEILSLVGSKDFFDERHDGQVNGTLSRRQPGSSLKPFTYALALEKGMTPATILRDVETQFITPEGSYLPQNYDQRYHGLVRMRSALACSYNVPAVSLLQRIGPDLLYQRLKMLCFESLKKSPSFYGVGLTLGNGEVTLLELTRAYSTLAREGFFLKEKPIMSIIDKNKDQVMHEGKPEPKRIFSPQVAYIITHILADKDARIPSFGYHSPLKLPFPCASKTGTSKDFRDNWTIGYTPKYTAGVWIGNFDGQPMHNVSGITGCGPIFRDIMLLLGKEDSGGEFKEPKDLVRKAVCPLTGKIPSKDCPGVIEEIFIKGTEPHNICLLHQKAGIIDEKLKRGKEKFSENEIAISFPLDGDVFKIDPVLRKEYQTLKLKASVPEGMGIKTIEWFLNGEKIGSSSFPFSFSWTLKPGFYNIKARAYMENKLLESQAIRVRIFL